ncbi:arylsulfatase [Dinghuibacter silviterrae]|nr:arylsulfatase [Dinghuibacter silviterrae]
MRHLSMVTLLTGVFAVASGAARAQTTAIALPARPNIIFILADDLGYGDTGPYGQRLIRTPSIDALAASGRVFTQMYAGTSVCAPSRCSLMTGLHTGHAYIRGNKEVKPEGQEPLPGSAVTLAAVLKKAGYTTGAFGKWGLGPVGSTGDPLRQGFDVFYGYNSQLESHRYYPTHLWDNDRRVPLEGVYAPDLIQKRLLSFIDRQAGGGDHAGGRPFFLYAAYTLPHAELVVPDDSIFESYVGRFPEKPYKGDDSTVGGYSSQPYPHATYAAMVTRLDRYVGQIMVKLREKGLDSNTLVIFTSDNGPHVEGGNDPAFFNSAGGLRGVKRDLYEGGIREPFIARWPGQIPAASRSTFIGAFWDMQPTFAALAGAPGLPGPDGLSIVPALTGSGTQPEHPWLYWEFHEDGGHQAVRQGRWKAVRLHVDKGPGGPVELYDLEKDPSEQHNVAAGHPDVARTLAAIMDSAHIPSSLFPFGYEH